MDYSLVLLLLILHLTTLNKVLILVVMDYSLVLLVLLI